MAGSRKLRPWAALALLCVAAGAAAFVVFGGIVGGVARPAPSPAPGNGPIVFSTDPSKPGYKLAQMPMERPGGGIDISVPKRIQAGGAILGATYMIITSDPQYPWKPEYDGHAGDCGDERACSRALIEAQYLSINRFVRNKDVLGTFINGDLTAFGHRWQIAYMQTAIKSLRTPVYLGLGNHDYENNVNDCYENNCVRNSVHWFREHMSKLQLDAFDFREDKYYNFPSNRTDIHGSLGWTKRFGDVTVIQVNNYPEYTTYAQGWNFDNSRREQIFITDGMRWLEGQLRLERAAGQAIIVMSHVGWGSDAFTALLNRYEVSAAFAGHFHDWLGPKKAWNLGDVPIFFSGSSVHRSYLIAERIDGNAELKLWVVEDNNEYNRKLAATIPLKRSQRYMGSELKSWVTIKNGADDSSELRARVGFTRLGRTEWSDPQYVSEVESFRVPAWAEHVTVHLERRQVDDTSPWHTVDHSYHKAQSFLCLRAGMRQATKC